MSDMDEIRRLQSELITARGLLKGCQRENETLQLRVSECEEEIARLRRCLAKQPNTYMIAYEDGKHERLAHALCEANNECDRYRMVLENIYNIVDLDAMDDNEELQRQLSLIAREAHAALGQKGE